MAQHGGGGGSPTNPLTSVPNTIPHGSSGHGWMYMPMVTFLEDGFGGGGLTITPDARVPVMGTLQDWSPGSWFQAGDPWRPLLGSPEGVGGTPAMHAGSGALFNNQYGLTMDQDSDFLPVGSSIAVRLVSASPEIRAFNGGSGSYWDEIWQNPGDQIVWNGSMWHNYFVIDPGAASGVYTAEFELFVVDYVFQPGTGAADYSAGALAAQRNLNYTSDFLSYQWEVHAIPEPSSMLLLGGAVLALWGRRISRRHV